MNLSKHHTRFSSLDIMRGLAVVLMIEAHIKILPAFLSLKLFSSILAAPFFLIAAGTGFQLFLRSRREKGHENRFIFLETFFRATILFLVTTSLFIIGIKIFPSSFVDNGIIKWNVFQVIAVGYIFGFFIRKSILNKIIAIISIFVISVLINYFSVNSLYFLIKGIFPVIPWVSYFIFGQIVYEVYDKNNFTIKNNLRMIGYSSFFLIFNILIIYLFPYEFVSSGRSCFPEFLLISSIFLFLIVIMIRWVDLKKPLRKICLPFASIGKIAFTAYYLQTLLVVLSYDFIFNSVPQGIANIIILLLVIMSFTIFEKLWRPYNYVFGLEWILRRGTKLIMFHIKKIFAEIY